MRRPSLLRRLSLGLLGCGLLLACTLSTGCRKSVRTGAWLYESASIDGAELVATRSDLLGRLETATFLSLYDDGAYVGSFMNEFEHGMWKEEKDKAKPRELALVTTDGMTRHLLVESSGGSRLRLLLTLQTAQGPLQIHLQFRREAHPEKREADPYALANNRWRVRVPGESPRAQCERLTGYTRWFVIRLEQAAARHAASAEFRGAPNVFNFYANGVGLLGEGRIPAAWTECFSDENGPETAHRLLGKALTRVKLPQQKHENFSLYLTIFRSMAEYLAATARDLPETSAHATENSTATAEPKVN